MVDERIFEAFEHIACKLLEFFHRKVECLHEFFKLNLVDVFAQNGVFAGVAYDVDAAEEGHWRENGVRAVEQSHLTSVVRLLLVGDEHVESGLVGREFGFHLFYGHVFCLLYYPQVEAFCLDNEVVFVADLLLDFLDGVAWEARNDAVYEGSANVAVVGEPVFEAFIVGSEVVFPQFDIFIDAVFEVMAVEEDELTRHENQALVGVTVEEFVAVEEQLNELSGIGRGRSVGKFATVVVGNAGFSGVADDETNFWLLGQCEESVVLRIRIEGAADDVNAGQCVDRLAIFLALKVDMIETVLLVEPVHHTAFDRLNDYNAAVEIGLLVHVPDNPVYKCA